MPPSESVTLFGAPQSKRQAYELLRSQLELERSSFLPHWRDLGDYILPRRPRFFITDTNRGDRRNQKIVDTTATLAARTLRSGMMSGITSPARPWFRLTTSDPDLSEIDSVKDWLYQVTVRMSNAFLKSNLYNCLPILYGDIGVFGTHVMWVEEDFKNLLHFTPLPIGSYSISNNSKLQVDTVVRQFRMTVRQLVEKFQERPNDWSNFSTSVKSFWIIDQKEIWIDVTHVVRPNPEFDPNKIQSKHKKYISCYYETGSNSIGVSSFDTNENVLLSEKGYDFFPALAVRWETTGEDVYATSCPGMDALGDIKQLQIQTRRMSQAIEKMVNPPLQGPTSLKGQGTSQLPGGMNFVDVREGSKGLSPVYEVNPRIQELEGSNQQVRDRIRRGFYEDLFLMLAQDDRQQPATAREIDERHEEKLLALGPVLEQLNQDLLDPLIDIAFEIGLRQGLWPEAPEELKGQPLKVEYVSIMAQAQKSIGISGVERFSRFSQEWAALMPSVLDKIDPDQMMDVYGDLTSVPPGVLRTDDMVAGIRQERAKAQQAQAMAEQAPAMASAVKDLGNTPTDGKNALTDLISQAQAGQLTQQAA
jgi:hypothetical protein